MIDQLEYDKCDRCSRKFWDHEVRLTGYRLVKLETPTETLDLCPECIRELSEADQRRPDES
jgi:hypothetical protein